MSRFENNVKIVEGAERVMGPMNEPTDSHPLDIIEACKVLGKPLPENATMEFQPSHYLPEECFSGELEEIKTLLGDKMPEIEEEELVKKHRNFNRKYKTQQNMTYTLVDFTVYFSDWLMHCRDEGFTHNCYFDYELYNKEPEIRRTFLNEGYRTRVHKAATVRKYRRIFLDKAQFNANFAKYVKRDWVDASVCTAEEFEAFVQKHDAFFAKPVCGTGGAGARVIESDSDTLENLFAKCQEEGLICEEIIKQHPVLSEINSSTLNTVRINTLVCADGVPRILLAAARFGRAGNVVDNFHGGGVGAVVDIESGKITSEAINRAHIRSPFHPDSHVKLLGMQYPEWEKVKAAVCDAALMVPRMRHIGWDVSVTADGEVEFVEGNGRPNFDILQSPDQIGRRERYENYIVELEELKAKKASEKAAREKAKKSPIKRARKFLGRIKRKLLK